MTANPIYTDRIIFVVFCFLSVGAASSDTIFERNNINVTMVNEFSGEDIRLACFTEEKYNSRSGKVIPDERRVLWEYTKKNSDSGEEGRAFFISRHVELPPSKYTEKKEIDHTLYTEGGEDVGAKCIFPFTAYNNNTKTNTTHYTCTASGKKDGRCWCGTVPFHHKPSTWGFCPCAAPIPGVTLYAEYGTDPGMPCVFPFHYKEKVYTECTRELDDDDRCWCATVKYRDDKKNDKYGYCPCAGPPNQGEWGTWSVWKKSECGKTTYRTRECDKPPGMTAQIGLGRHLFCDGSSYEFKLFTCKEYDAGKDDLHTVSLQKRAQRAGRKRTDNSVAIKSTVVYDSGLYSCKVTSEHLNIAKFQYINPRKTMAMYLVNIVDKSKAETILLGDANEYQTPTMYGGYKLKYKWENWGPCNRCGLWVGEQRKGGFCYTRDVRGSIDLPCDSPLLEESQREATKSAPNYIAYRTCHVNCVKIERWYMALPRRKPPVFLTAARRVVNVHFGDNVRLDCDINRSNFPAWQYDHPSGKISQLIYVHENTETRYIDAFGRLMLVNAQKSTEGYYSCFINRKLRRNYRIFVSENVSDMEDAVSNSPPYIRIGIVVFIIVTIALKVATTRIEK
uniref:uncharacterized protein LOC120339872 isoform X1 n=1 Tax=Styela clava TaxID=7725 RepID=UPI001939CA71|nr:uncharacterized protein LOC120339872 isoform X1 [Styela clava]